MALQPLFIRGWKQLSAYEQFCSRNKVPYNIFYKWYKDTRNKIV